MVGRFRDVNVGCGHVNMIHILYFCDALLQNLHENVFGGPEKVENVFGGNTTPPPPRVCSHAEPTPHPKGAKKCKFLHAPCIKCNASATAKRTLLAFFGADAKLRMAATYSLPLVRGVFSGSYDVGR